MEDKANQRAFERYPDYREMDGEYVTQIHKRKVFAEGYHQAEKDNELTWENMFDIFRLVNEVLDDFAEGKTKKEVGEEVLKRFKDFKERKEK